MIRRRAALLLAAATLLALAAPAGAEAHANLARSQPPANASLDSEPGQVQLWFTERPEPRLSEIQVFDSSRQRVDSGPVSVDPADSESLVEHLRPNLPTGVYTISWRTTSAVDGHVTGGALAFGIGAAPSASDLLRAPAAEPSQGGPASLAIRWLVYLSLLALVGLSAFPDLVVAPVRERPRRDAAVRASLTRLLNRCETCVQVVAIIALLATADSLIDQAWRSTGSFSLASLAATSETSVGLLLLARAVVAAAILAVSFSRIGRALFELPAAHRSLGAAAASAMEQSQRVGASTRPILPGLVLLALLLTSFEGHSAAVSQAPELAIFVDWLHLTLAGVWLGGAGALVLAVMPATGGWTRPSAAIEPADVSRNELFGPILGQFSHLALAAAVGLAATGAYQTYLHVGSIENLLSTDYGRTLLVKTAVFAAALVVAAFHRLVLKPLLARPERAGATRARRFFARSLPLELLLGIAVLMATALLTSLPPAAAEGATGPIMTRTVGDLRVALEVQPLAIGANRLDVTLQSGGQPVDNAEKVEVQFQMLDMDMGTSTIDLQHESGGRYAAQSDALSMSGRWRLNLLVRAPGQLDQRTSFDVSIKP